MILLSRCNKSEQSRKMKNVLKICLSIVFVVVGIFMTNPLSATYTLNLTNQPERSANTEPGGGPRFIA